MINSLSKTLKSKNIYKNYINKNKMFPCRSESALLVDCVINKELLFGFIVLTTKYKYVNSEGNNINIGMKEL